LGEEGRTAKADEVLERIAPALDESGSRVEIRRNCAAPDAFFFLEMKLF